MQKGQPVRTVAAPGLAALLMSGNSGGIVGLIVGLIVVLGVRPGRGCAPFRLGLATLEVLPQRRAQAPLLACPLRILGPIVHGGKDTSRRRAKEGPPCDGCRGRSVLAPLWTLWQGSPHSRPHFFYSSGPALP